MDNSKRKRLNVVDVKRRQSSRISKLKSKTKNEEVGSLDDKNIEMEINIKIEEPGKNLKKCLESNLF